MSDTTHPDATAFAARFLVNPKDRLGRLVFADWLEEQGDDSSVAWADYIRVQAEMEQLRWNDPAWDELTERATDSGRRVQAYLRITVRSEKSLLALPKFIPPHRCVLNLTEHPFLFNDTSFLPESLAWEHSLIPLHSTPTTEYLACPTPADWKMYEKLVYILNSSLHVFGIEPAGVLDQIRSAYGSYSPTRTTQEWPLPVYDPVAEVAELEKLLNESIAVGVSTVRVLVTPNEWRSVRVICFTRSGRREREQMSMFDFRRVVAAVMRRTADRLPRTFPAGEFTHQHDERTYLISALASAEGLTLWIRSSPAFVDPIR